MPTLVKEDGTGLDTANSYTDRTFADAYHENRGRSDWSGYSTAIRDAALIRATQYIDSVYGLRFLGSALVSDQALEWPRENAYFRDEEIDGVPTKLAQATAELALFAARDGELQPRTPGPRESVAGVLSGTSSSGSVKKKVEQVGSLMEQTEYTVGSFASAFPSVHGLIQSLISVTTGVIR